MCCPCACLEPIATMLEAVVAPCGCMRHWIAAPTAHRYAPASTFARWLNFGFHAFAIHTLRAAILKHIPEIKGMVTDSPNSDIVCYFNLPFRTSTMRPHKAAADVMVLRRCRTAQKRPSSRQRGSSITTWESCYAGKLLHATHSSQCAPPHSNQE